MQVEVPKKWRLRPDVLEQVRGDELLRLRLALMLDCSAQSITRYLKVNHFILTTRDALSLIHEHLKLPTSGLGKDYEDEELGKQFKPYKGHEKKRVSPWKKSKA